MRRFAPANRHPATQCLFQAVTFPGSASSRQSLVQAALRRAVGPAPRRALGPSAMDLSPSNRRRATHRCRLALRRQHPRPCPPPWHFTPHGRRADRHRGGPRGCGREERGDDDQVVTNPLQSGDKSPVLLQHTIPTIVCNYLYLFNESQRAPCIICRYFNNLALNRHRALVNVNVPP